MTDGVDRNLQEAAALGHSKSEWEEEEEEKEQQAIDFNEENHMRKGKKS